LQICREKNPKNKDGLRYITAKMQEAGPGLPGSNLSHAERKKQ